MKGDFNDQITILVPGPLRQRLDVKVAQLSLKSRARFAMAAVMFMLAHDDAMILDMMQDATNYIDQIRRSSNVGTEQKV